ncbi:MAG TPA: hypothetical protein VI653_13000 [Steroidobacteraceae bacterium]
MLTSYLSDIEQMLDEQRWEAALREALDLPQIAVALSDSHLSASGERIKAWCDQWIRPVEPDRNAHGADYERVCSNVLSSTVQKEGDNVPSLALKRLRLRRHARTPPRGFSFDRTGTVGPEANTTIDTCTILVEAARRWYAHSAVHDSVVQANLARLAVLR